MQRAVIAARISVLNTTFAGGEGGARTGFSFRLAGVTRTDMDYSYDSCYTEFTAGQSQRMRDAWLFYRA